MAKGIAAGLALGAFIARAEQMSWPPGSHGSTFGGNPVACAAGLVTLDLLDEGLMENAAKVGEQLKDGLREIAATHNEISDVRGLGLMLAMEFRTADQAAALVQSTSAVTCSPLRNLVNAGVEVWFSALSAADLVASSPADAYAMKDVSSSLQI